MSIFSKIPITRPKRSTFVQQHEWLGTYSEGILYPLGCTEIMSGDTASDECHFYLRMAPMQAPIMQNINCYVRHFFIPFRLLVRDFEKFITGGKKGDFTGVLPWISYNSIGVDNTYHGSLIDHLGYPTINGFKEYDSLSKLNMLDKIELRNLQYVLAYHRIWYDYFRDETITQVSDELIDLIDDGLPLGQVQSLPNGFFDLHKVCWSKDYFTSALPDPQRGVDVTIPINGNFRVEGDPDLAKINGPVTGIFQDSGSSAEFGPMYNTLGSIGYVDNGGESTGTQRGLLSFDNTNLKVTQDGTSSVTVNDLRTAFGLQRIFEKLARSGSRYVEWLRSFFGEAPTDATLQRAQYLGGGRTPITISEVLQNSQTTTGDDASPLGQPAGRGTALGSTNGFKRHFKEPGVLMSVMYIRPQQMYTNLYPRHLLRRTRFDFAFPDLAHLGEQPIQQCELQGLRPTTDIDDSDAPFGYQSRYSEYKYTPSTVHGDFKGNMAFWHMARNFGWGSPALLNQSFLEVNASDFDRVWNVDDSVANGHYWMQFYHNMKFTRNLPYFGEPKL